MRAAAAIAAAALLLAGCGSGRADTGAVAVFAAASLRTVLTEIAADYEETHPGVDVRLVFAGSGDLVAQIGQGAPADVLAVADRATMLRAEGDGLLTGPASAFAANTMRVVVPADNPAGIRGAEDLGRPGVRLVVCAPVVPCGAATLRVQESLGVQWRPVSEESSVAGVMGKIASGEADAGVVYVTDALAEPDRVVAIPIPDRVNAATAYYAAPVSDAPHAKGFAGFLAGPGARATLRQAGFEAP